MEFVILESREGLQIIIEFDILLKHSNVIKQMHELTEADNRNPIIPVHGVNHETLLKLRRWMRYHKSDDVPEWVHLEDKPDDIDPWIDDFDKEFLDGSHSDVVEIMKGADYLDMPWLTTLCIRKLGVQNPFHYIYTFSTSK